MFLWAFLVGGLLSMAAQLVVDLTPLTPAHTMVLFVSLGAVLSALGVYGPLIQLAGAGATVPLPAFGHAMVEGAVKAAQARGPVGLLTGGFETVALGLTVAILFGYVMALVFDPKG